jgi:hypothetical protein
MNRLDELTLLKPGPKHLAAPSDAPLRVAMLPRGASGFRRAQMAPFVLADSVFVR